MDEHRKFVRPNNLVEKFVLVDGIGRSGKVVMGLALASMKNVEKMRIDLLFDSVPRMYEMNKISHDGAVTLLRLEADTRFYETMISRSVNFKPTDYTGVFKDPYTLRYILRLFSEEGESVVKRIRKEKPIFQNMTHDGLSRAKILFDAFGDRLYIIEMLRDPIGIIYDWHVKNFGERIGKDPREQHLTLEWNGDVVPFIALGWENEYLSIKPIDRIIRMIDTRFRRNIEGYKKLSEENKKRTMFVVFERFVVDPMPYCKEIAKFIGTEITSITERKMRQEKCPRKINPDERIKMKKIIVKQASEKYIKMLNELTEEYGDLVKNMFESH